MAQQEREWTLMNSRDLFIVAALLCTGTIVRFILVQMGEPVTPNVLVAFYSLAIMVTLPSFGESVGIGFAAGIIASFISRSVFNPAFLISEPLGAAVCLGVFLALRYHKQAARFAAPLLATIASGLVFLSLAVSAGSSGVQAVFPDTRSFLITLLGVVAITALVNSLAAGLAYPHFRPQDAGNT